MDGTFPLFKKELLQKEYELYRLYIKYSYSRLPNEINILARKMNVQVKKTFLNLLMDTCSHGFCGSYSSLLGVYGNYYAILHLEKQKYHVIPEYSIENELGVTAADVMYFDNGQIHLGEVKTVPFLLKNEEKHIFQIQENEQFLPYEFYEYSKNYRAVDTCIRVTNKLEQQLLKLQNHKNAVVHLIVFKDTVLSTLVLQSLERKKISVIRLPQTILEVHLEVRNLLCDIYCYGRNLLAEFSYTPYGIEKEKQLIYHKK